MKAHIEHINPPGMMKNAAFSQAVVTSGPGKTVYIGGQNAVDAQGSPVGTDIEGQTRQVMKNLETALRACGAGFENLVKLTIHMVSGQDAMKGFQVSQEFMGHLPHPPAITVLFVSGLVHPSFLVEIDAIAFVPAS